jgi:release factor glutamine methyltransferase
VRQVVAAAGRLLRPGGWLLVEVGGDQDTALAPALATAGFDPGEPWHDGEGDLRGVAARRRPSG